MIEPIDDPILAAVKELWEASSELTVEEAMADAESAVVRWAWFTDDWCCSPEPFCAQRNGYAPGRELRREPDVDSDPAKCGFDEHDRCVASSEYHNAGENVFHNARFFEADTCRQLLFDDDELVSVTLYVYDQGHLLRQAELDRRNPRSPWRYLMSEYFYGDEGRLERVHVRDWGGNRDDETLRRAAAGRFEEFEYDDEGALARITARAALPGPAPWVLYKRRKKGPSARTVQTKLESQLAQAVEDAARACAFDDEVWCLALHYDRGSPLAPYVVLGAERERSEWGADVDLLNPAEWDAHGPPRLIKLEDPALLDACAEAWEAMSTGDEGPEAAIKILNAAAKRLDRAPLGDHLNVTEDFFVYAVDLELEDVDANLQAVLGKERYRKLLDAGLTAP